MRKTLRGILVVVAVTLLAAVGAYAQAKPATVTCVGLYSETDAGTVSYRVGQGAWVIVRHKTRPYYYCFPDCDFCFGSYN